MKRSLLTLALLLSLGASAWQKTQRDGLTVYQPEDIGDRGFMVMELKPLPSQGQSLAEWLEPLAEKMSAKYGSIQEKRPVEITPTIATLSHRLEVQGRPFMASYSAFATKDGDYVLMLLLAEIDRELFQKYQGDALALINERFHAHAGDSISRPIGLSDGIKVSVHKPASSPAAAIGKSSASQQAITKALEGMNLGTMQRGGPLTMGSYQCSSNKGQKFSLNLYDNGQFRVNDADVRNEKEGKYSYQPDSGLIDVDDDYHLLNFAMNDEVHEIAFFFTKEGKGYLYGQDLTGLGSPVVICQHSGAAKEPSPEAKDAAEREAKRFKWVTAPNQGVKMDDIEVLLHHGYNEYLGAQVDFIEEARLLLKDGWLYDNLRCPPADLDVAASRKNEPEHWHRWRKADDGYEMEKDGSWEKVPGIAVTPAKAGERLNGSYTNSSYAGSPFTGGIASFDSYHFKDDGSFDSSARSVGGSGPLNSLDASVHVGSYAASAPGKYELDGYTLQLTLPDGTVQRKPYYRWSEHNISIDGATYSDKD